MTVQHDWSKPISVYAPCVWGLSAEVHPPIIALCMELFATSGTIQYESRQMTTNPVLPFNKCCIYCPHNRAIDCGKNICVIYVTKYQCCKVKKKWKKQGCLIENKTLASGTLNSSPFLKNLKGKSSSKSKTLDKFSNWLGYSQFLIKWNSVSTPRNKGKLTICHTFYYTAIEWKQLKKKLEPTSF